jgi:hypothetical protein
MMADEGHEAARFQSARLEGVPVPLKVKQFLILRITHRQDQPAAFRELRTKRLGNPRRCGGDEYGIKRSKVRKPQRASAARR